MPSRGTRARSQARARPVDASFKNGISDASFRDVANYTYDWESWHAPNGRLLWVNPAVERLVGYSPEECLAMPDYPLPIVASESRDVVIQILTDAMNGLPGNDKEFCVVLRNGSACWMTASWQTMYDESGKSLGFRTSMRDFTERRSLREQIRLHAEHLEQLVQERTIRIQQLERHRRQMEKLAALGQLAAGVAHEVNNPLAGIRNAFQLIKSDLSPDHEHFDLLELIDREIERISSIVHQMYQVYRHQPQAPRPFDLARSTTEVTVLLEGAARKQQVRLVVDSVDGSARVTLPEGEVKQILYNLVHNAIQASPANHDVRVGVARSGDELRVTVTDSGSGIPDDVLPRIFDPFFSTRPDGPNVGMGLGLSISRGLIEAMGGHIEVVSRAGLGSRFAAVFPMCLAAAGSLPLE